MARVIMLLQRKNQIKNEIIIKIHVDICDVINPRREIRQRKIFKKEINEQ